MNVTDQVDGVSERLPDSVTELVARVLFRVSQILWALVLLLILIAPARAEVIAEVGSELGAPHLVFDDQGSAVPALLTGSRVEMSVVGSSVEVTLKQTFLNQREDWLNAIYLMPLPDGAAVRGLTLEVDGRRIVGAIREREQARAEFVAASEAGQRASLLEQTAGDLFNLEVANVPPDGGVTVQVSLTLNASLEGEWWSVRLPTTITPRYRLEPDNQTIRRAEDMRDYTEWQQTITAPSHEKEPRPLFHSPQSSVVHGMAYHIQLRSHGRLGKVLTPLHQSAMAWRGNALEITPKGGGLARMDRDLILRWQIAGESMPDATLLVEAQGDDYYADLAVMPPAPQFMPAPPPRELVLVIDISGSMAGVSIDQALAAAETALNTLGPQDRFDVVTFESATEALFGELVTATPQALAEARRYLRRVRADGGTEMLPALQAALGYADDEDKGALRQVLFITDGAVYDETHLFQYITRHLGRTRLFTVAIGPAPNTRFMRRAAGVGRGVYRQIATLPEVEQVLSELLQTMSYPVVTDIEIDWPQQVEAALPESSDLYLGQLLQQRVRLEDLPQGGEIEIRGFIGNEPWQTKVTLPSPFTPVRQGSALASSWAQQRIERWLDDALLSGLDQSAVRDQVLALGLAHQIVTPFTSFVAIEEWITRPPWSDAGDYRVPAMPPAGASQFAQTASGVGLWLYGGLFSLLMGLIILRMNEEVSADATPAL